MTKEEREHFIEFSSKIDEMEKTMAEFQAILPILKQLTEAWEAAGWFGKALKWTGGLAVSVAAIIAMFKIGFWNR